ncbi:hypothetical protein [Thioalkalivibrio thiocyanoxidans]|uniref:hypothetical protein n=1 Tax=Thioalkalivibrio thiocyanoxidans TaxID=152475 RepID=UPI00039C7614|nr:hypothetical protein [Thioalkalivibrio thiocyanoxidans]
MCTLFVHPGHFKTGSSFLQSVFALNAEELERQGVQYPMLGSMGKAADGRISSGNGKLLVDSRKFSRLKLKAGVSALFSNEWLFEWLGEPDGLERVAEIVEDLGFSQVKVLLFIRDPIDHLASFYQQMVKRGGYCGSIDEYAQTFDVPERVERFLSALEKSGLNAQVDVHHYGREKGDLVGVVEAWLGLPGETLRVRTGGLVNRSLSLAELEFQRAVNEFLGPSGELVADPLCNSMPHIEPHYVQASHTVQKELLERLTPAMKKVNQRVPGTAAYEWDFREHVEVDADDGKFRLDQSQIRVIAEGLASEIGRLRDQIGELDGKVRGLEAGAQASSEDMRRLKARLRAEKERSRRTRKKLEAERARVELIRASRSWRLTRPFRLLWRSVRRVRTGMRRGK